MSDKEFDPASDVATISDNVMYASSRTRTCFAGSKWEAFGGLWCV